MTTTDERVSDLKPCPFCGCEVELVSSKNAPDRLLVIACKSPSPCIGSGLGGFYILESQREEGIAAWNRRSVEGGVRVKPLVFSPPWPADKMQARYATSTGHSYTVIKALDGQWLADVRFWACGEAYKLGAFDTEAEAIAAAQADYEARILSALSPQPNDGSAK